MREPTENVFWIESSIQQLFYLCKLPLCWFKATRLKILPSSIPGMGAKFEPSHCTGWRQWHRGLFHKIQVRPGLASLTYNCSPAANQLMYIFSFQLKHVQKNRQIVKAPTVLVQSGLEAARSKILPSSFAGMGAKFEPSHSAGS